MFEKTNIYYNETRASNSEIKQLVIRPFLGNMCFKFHDCQ